MRPSMRLHHGALSVRDMDESIAFYRDLFGFQVDTQVVVDPGFRITHMRLGDSYIELFWRRGHGDLPSHARELESDLDVLGTKHLAFETEDPEGMYAYLQARGVEMVTDIRGDNPDYRYFFIKDINGILLEFVSRK